MSDEIQEILFDLLTKQATYGLDSAEQVQLDELMASTDHFADDSFELTAAAIGMTDLDASEPMPVHLRSKILASADEYFATAAIAGNVVESAWPPPEPIETEDLQPTFEFEPKRSSMGWLGWLVATAACIVLALNIWFTRINPIEVAPLKNPPPTPELLTPEQEFAQLLASPSVVKANWAPGNVKELKDIGGDVVWSDEKQKGFMHLRGLPVNDKTKETYQLWIFDKTQDKATPIDGGTFDVDKNGEVIIPINAKLKAQGAQMFAITVEKPGGVVVSKREKVAALAKVET